MPTRELAEKYGKPVKGETLPTDPEQLSELARKFWRKVTKGDGCWLYRGAPRGAKPFAEFTYRYVVYWAHCVAYQLQRGPIPEGSVVLHSCNSGLCVRGDHLYLGDRASAS